MKVIISGGGTGGHIYPALTIAAAIEAAHPSADILFVGTKRGLESSIVPKAGYKIEYIEVEGFSRKLGKELFKNLYMALKGCMQAFSLLRKHKPDLVIGTGGYVCGPIVLIARLLGIKACIQEQNAKAGITNKILAEVVNRVFLGYKEATTQLGNSSKNVFTGNPVRASIFVPNKQESREFLGLAADKHTLLIYGGSRGARSINTAALDFYKQLADFPNLQVLHITGESLFAEVKSVLDGMDINQEQVKLYPYMHDMDKAINAADFAVSRAGAIAIAEFLALGMPSILIPYPYATDNHQELNARAVADNGAGIMILDRDFSGQKLADAVKYLFGNDGVLESYAINAKKIGNKNAAADIVRIALALVGK